jgi:putative SOS response-associated peptidase YedK
MCGKFTQHYTWQQVHAFSQPLIVDRPDELVVSTPMRPAYILRLDQGGQRIMVPMRWGFSGVNDKTPSKPRHIHARGETIDTLRTFAQAFQEARGILMVATFNEGEEVGSKTKQWVITPKAVKSRRGARLGTGRTRCPDSPNSAPSARHPSGHTWSTWRSAVAHRWMRARPIG